MAETLAHYSFLPWFRQGLDSQIVEKDTLGAGAGAAVERAQLNVSVVLEALALDGVTTHDHTITKKINVIGPGDVKNISERVVVRLNPARNLSNFEANNLAYIEFYEEDFLWRYTPASPDLNNAVNSKRLRPWLALIVLKDDEFEEQYIADSLPFITVKSDKFDTAFHKHTQTWALAHVHFNQVLESQNAAALINEVTAELDADADTAVCRLLCPRKLNKNTHYTAFVIPAFETGRLSGLGLDTAGISAQEASWAINANQSAKPRPYDFPVYYQWRFGTGNDGDFESLVAKLKPIIMKPESGMMAMDVQEPGYGMDGDLKNPTVGMEAALRPPTFETIRKTFPVTPDEVEVRDQLLTFLNLSPSINQPEKIRDNIDNDAKAFNPFYEGSLTDDPIIVPPLYGAWHSMAEDLKTGNNYPWFIELNLDFRNRAAAGLGTQVVQKEQENLMNRAWQQVDKINEANQKIIEAEFARLINNAIYKKHLNGAPVDKFLTVTQAMQNLTVTADKSTTVKTMFEQSRIPVAAQGAGFAKMSRSLKKFKSLNLKSGLLNNFNKDGETTRVTAARLKTAPGAALPVSAANAMIANAISFYNANPLNAAKDIFFDLLNNGLNTSSLANLKSSLQTALVAKPGVPAATKTNVDTLISDIQSYNAGGQLEVTFGKIPYETTFDNFSAGKIYDNAKILNAAMAGNPEAKVMAATTINDIQYYQQRLGEMSDRIAAMPVVALKDSVADLNSVRTNVSMQIMPDFALDRRVKSNIKIWDGLLFKPVKELKPAMAYPEFPDPAYEYLEKISQNFILPNVDKLPVNTITLLETNQRFIESYMAGLNHEMARELLWREYPTDQRGSYFRQFWNIIDNLADDNPADEDDKKDIKPMDKWTGQLGTHRPGFNGDILVLIVRGELFHKYPNTVVYAQKAVYDSPANKSRLLSDPAEIKFPLFSAELKPDIMLFGFELTAEQANGHRIESAGESTVGKNPGWFFVFKERPGQLQFGLNDYTTEQGDTSGMPPAGSPATWNDLSWEHMVAAKNDLESYQLDFTKAINITDANSVKDKYSQQVPVWNSNAAEIASILYQDPVLFARHAGEMLNEDLLNT